MESLLKFLGITCLVLNIAGSFTLKLKSEQIPAIIFNIDGRFEETPLLRDSETANYLSVSSPIIYEHEITEYAEEREQRCQQEPLGIEGEVQSAITSIAILDRESEILDRIELEDIICFRSLDSYLLGTNMVIIVGVGLMYINNVGSISIIDLN